MLGRLWRGVPPGRFAPGKKIKNHSANLMKVVRLLRSPSFSTSLLSLLLFSTAALILCFSAAEAPAQAAVQAGRPNFAPGEVLVQFKAAATDAELRDAVTRAGLTIKEHIH